jgi:hypothetical protein
MSSRFSIEAVVSMIDKVSGPMKNAGTAVSTFSGKTESHFGKLRSVISSFLPMLSLVGFMAFANKAIGLFRIQEAAVTNVESAIRATGNAAGISSKQFQDMASKLQENSIFGDESILQNVTAQLLTFNQIKGTDVFEKAQVAVADIASRLEGVNASGETLKGISIMLGKVLQDPVNKMDSLARRGIIFSDAEKNTVKSLMAQGKLQQAQLFLLDAISKAGYGGAAKDLAGTSAGKAIQNQNKIGDAMELAGAKLQPLKITMTSFIVAVLPVLIGLMESFGVVLESLMPAVIWLKKGFKLIAPLIPPIVYAFIAWKVATWGMIAAQWALGAISALNAIRILGFSDGIKYLMIGIKSATATQWGFNAAMLANPLTWIPLVIAVAVGWFAYLNSHIEEMNRLFLELTSILDKPIMKQILSGIFGGSMISFMSETRNKIIEGTNAQTAATREQGQLAQMPFIAKTYASPESNKIASGGGNTVNGNVNINIQSDQKNTSVESKGMPDWLGIVLNKGLQGQAL